MLLTVSTTHRPATDLGYLLYKHPERAREFAVGAGTAHVFYPEAGEERCTAALLLEVDPVELARARPPDGFSLGQYVNDRAYAASSLLAVALGRVFRTALRGVCAPRPDLAATPIPLEIAVPALPCRGGPELAHRLFGPLGWSVTAAEIPLDPAFPDWGASPYLDLRLAGTLRLADALNHLYVLLPVLDDAKHYWVAPEEVDKLVRAGGGWLGTHPERGLIARRYLAHQRSLAAAALARLAEADDAPADGFAEPDEGRGHDAAEERVVSLAEQRRGAILSVLRAAGARRVVDLGCGEGKLLRDLLADPSFTEIVGVDVAPRTLAVAARRLRLDELSDRRRARITLLHSALTYRDDRLAGYDAAVLSEVVEHVDPPRLGALERAVFGYARPATVVVTTPNREYNTRWDWLPAGRPRHPDHRFEWTRAEFADWARAVADRYGYTCRLLPVGPEDAEVGSPTQLAVFGR